MSTPAERAAERISDLIREHNEGFGIVALMPRDGSVAAIIQTAYAPEIERLTREREAARAAVRKLTEAAEACGDCTDTICYAMTSEHGYCSCGREKLKAALADVKAVA